jgi:hypothetical protein
MASQHSLHNSKRCHQGMIEPRKALKQCFPTLCCVVFDQHVPLKQQRMHALSQLPSSLPQEENQKELNKIKQIKRSRK